MRVSDGTTPVEQKDKKIKKKEKRNTDSQGDTRQGQGRAKDCGLEE